MSGLVFAVILSSVRPGRMNDRVSKFIVNQLESKGHKTIIIDPLEYKLPMLEMPIHWDDRSKAPEILRTISDKLNEADAFVVVSAEYNHSFPPALSNLMSHFGPEYLYKPSGIVCYSPGGYGGVRASMALRPFLGELGCSSTPSILAISHVGQALDENGVPSSPKTVEFSDRFLAELFWYTEAMKIHRAKTPGPK